MVRSISVNTSMGDSFTIETNKQKIPFPSNLLLGPNFALKSYTGKKKNLLFQEHSKYLKERLVFAYLLYPKPKHP